MTEKEKIELLITRWYNKEATEEETRIINSWKEKSNDNKAFYKCHIQLLEAQQKWLDKSALASAREKAKTGVIHQLLGKQKKVKQFVYGTMSVLILGLGLTFGIMNQGIEQRDQLLAGEFRIQADEDISTFLLPDSSQVWLNESSELTFKYNMADGERLAGITGEAYFKVAHDQKHPFIVEGYNHKVKVYGTEFNMLSKPEQKECVVTLHQGSVGIFNYDEEEVARLVPGQQFHTNKDGSVEVGEVSNVDVVKGWIDGSYEFKDATLEEIAAKMSEIYGVSIKIEDKQLKEHKYRCVIKKERSVERTLQILSITTDLAYEINDQYIILKRK
jgi:ferric-dicitrate binding protein FerR (iron transport regulator)